MDRDVNADHWLFVSDMDDTLLGDDGALRGLAEPLERARDRLTIVYNSSRPCASIRRSLIDHPDLPAPDYLIGALGTEIEEAPSGRIIEAYHRHLSAGWRRDAIAALMDRLGFAPHPDEYQTPLKASYDVPGGENVERVLEQLAGHELHVKVIYSGDKNLDIIPAAAGKGTAVDFLRRSLGFDATRVVVAGDSANDRDMLIPPFRGIVVANADPVMKTLSGEHIYHAQARCAAGVLEGLRHWGVL